MSKDLFSAPTKEEDALFAVPSKDELNVDNIDEGMDLFAPPSQDEITSSSSIAPALGTTGGAIAGYGAGKLINKAIVPTVSHVGNKLLQVAGNLSEPEIDFIKSNSNKYKNSQSLEKTLADFKNLSQDVANTTTGASSHISNNIRKTAEDTKEAGYKLAQEAKDSLLNQAPMSKEDYFKGIKQGLDKSSGAFSDITPAAMNQFFHENYHKPLAEHKSNIEKRASQLSGEIEGLKANLDPHDMQKYVEINSQIKNKEKQLSKLGKDTPDISKSLAEKAAKTYQQKVIGLPPEILDLYLDLGDKALNPAYQDMVNKAVGFGNDPMRTLNADYIGGKSGLIPLLRESADFDKTGSTGPADRIATNISEGVREKAGEIYPEYGQKMTESSKAIKAKEALEASGVKIDDNGNVSLPASKAKSIKEMHVNPELYPDEVKQLNSALDQSAPFSKNQPLQLAKDRLQQSAKIEEGLKSFGVKVDKLGNVEVPDAAKNKILDLVNSTAKEDQPKLERLQSLLDQARSISSDPNGMKGTDLLTELKAGGIKNAVDASGNISQHMRYKLPGIAVKSGAGALAGSQIGGANGAAVGAGLGLGLDLYGTKLQEQAALLAGSKAGKLAGTIAKETIPVLGGLAGGMIGYNSAHAAGFPKEQAAAIGVAEGINPIPFTDVAQGAVEAKKDYDKNQSIPSAIKAGAGGFISPLATVANIVGEGASNDARSRMEQRFKAADGITRAKPTETPKNDFHSFVDQHPDALRSLADQLSSLSDAGASAYAGPLLKAAEAPERSKAAILFGLYQQPAFRQLQKQLQDQNSNTNVDTEEAGPWTKDLTSLKKN